MSRFVIENAQVVRPGIGIESGYVCVENGLIRTVCRGEAPADIAGERMDAGGKRLTPGLVDMHTHGMHAHGYEQGVESLAKAAGVLGRYGTTTVVPTLVPMIGDAFLKLLNELTGAISEIRGVSIPGVHLEGPFVAIAGAACDTRDGDLALLDELLSASNGCTSIMSIAPEVPNILPVIERLVESGIKPFITHTRASVEQTQAAIDAGARHATHFYDVFPVPAVTDPGVRPVGVVETVLGSSRASCDFIADGIHVDPMAIRAAVNALGWERVALITDASFGAGMPPGDYETPWGYPVHIAEGNAPRIADPNHPHAGALAGSALTMDRGIRNLGDWLNLKPEQIWAMGTSNPARIAGLAAKGRMEEGADADLVLWSDCLEPIRTWVSGEIVFEASSL